MTRGRGARHAEDRGELIDAEPIDEVHPQQVALARLERCECSTTREIKLVQDGVSQHLAIAYQRERATADQGPIFQDVMLAQSSEFGATWSTEMIATPSMPNAADEMETPTVAIEAGWQFVAFYQSYSPDPVQRCGTELCGLVRLESRNGETGAWDDMALPPTSTGSDCDSVTPSISIGVDLEPSVAFTEFTDDSDENISYYYGGSSHVAFDTNGEKLSVTGVSLVVEDETPLVAATATRQDASNDNVWFAAGSDQTGTSWTAVQNMPPNGPNNMSGYVSLAERDSSYSIVSDFEGVDGAGAPAQCGGPNLSTSTNAGATWSSCGVDPDAADSYAGLYATVQYASTGKRVVAYYYTTPGTSLDDGIIVWREP
ncbi:MAG TPA: hypothetical protein VGG74_01315 [Kofleriaceae bacterium]|jgi:hypothetical protein